MTMEDCFCKGKRTTKRTILSPQRRSSPFQSYHREGEARLTWAEPAMPNLRHLTNQALRKVSDKLSSLQGKKLASLTNQLYSRALLTASVIIMESLILCAFLWVKKVRCHRWLAVMGLILRKTALSLLRRAQAFTRSGWLRTTPHSSAFKLPITLILRRVGLLRFLSFRIKCLIKAS